MHSGPSAAACVAVIRILLLLRKAGVVAVVEKKSAPRDAQARRALALLMDLLALPGPSGGEQPVAEFIGTHLERFALPAGALASDRAFRKSPLGGSTGNLALRLPGTRRAPRRMLAAHMDTVPLCAGARPVRKGGRIVAASRKTALGGDDRTGCAVLLAAALEILEQGLPHPPLTFLWTVQEEAGLHGARYVHVPMLRKPALVFNFDGGPAHRLKLGATGGYRMFVTVEGVASHAGMHPEHGVSAIAIASLAVAELVQGGWHGLVVKGKRRGTSNVGVIQGGLATNVVSDRVELKVEARSHDPKFRGVIVREIERAFHNAAGAVHNESGACGRVAIEGRLDYEAFRLERTEPCVAAAAAAIAAEGLEPEFAVANGGLDANWLTHNGLPAVTLGCGQHEIHTVDEYVEVEEFLAGCRVAMRLATSEPDHG
jgi:tripeptide aminopeptidase